MYQNGAYIIYGNTGVCRVEGTTTPRENSVLSGHEKDRLFYVLKPLYRTETIYTPVSGGKVFTRPVVSAAEAEQLIGSIPFRRGKAFCTGKPQELRAHYEGIIAKTHTCADLIELAMSVHAKKEHLHQQNRKVSSLDEQYGKQAEDLLCGEFAVALNMSKEDVNEYIQTKVSSAQA